ncbi:MAG: MarR family transcriptional regulator [Nitrospira sp.]|jgi:DNA-binding MarR family transcriptional regulator|nr:MAG: MarR family transcriptional regulator [Nitrospira sp.]
MQVIKIDRDELPGRLVTGLSKIGLAMKSRPWRRQGRQGVGPLQVQVLLFLRTQPNRCAMVSVIAKELSVKLPTASEVIRTLELKQLVRRRRSDTDNRVVTVHLTAKGMKASQVGTGWPEALAAATQQLSGPEQANLLAILVKMIRALQLQGEIPVARMCVSCEHFSPNAHPNSAASHHCQFIDTPLADQSLRLDCSDYIEATPLVAKQAWEKFIQAKSA